MYGSKVAPSPTPRCNIYWKENLWSDNLLISALWNAKNSVQDLNTRELTFYDDNTFEAMSSYF